MTNNLIQCRSCNHQDLQLILSLGNTPLANALLTPEQLSQPEEKYPLDVVFCPECSLVQITETVAPEKLFREYVYFSSFADTAIQNAKNITQKLIKDRKLSNQSLVMEIASNDGYLLQFYQRENIPVLGIEPALNIAKVAQEKGINTISEFFGKELALKLQSEGKKADIIHANNVLAHVADLNGFVEGIYLTLKDEGMAIIEVPYLHNLIDGCEFDTIYHEHLCYFSLTALNNLFMKHNLYINDVEKISIHGGTLRIFVGKKEERSPQFINLLKAEQNWGVNNFEYYQHFGKKVNKLKQKLLGLLTEIKANNQRIVVYGASAKGSTLLNYFGLGKDILEYVVDRSTIKQGKYTPGTHLPIYATEKLLIEMPDYVLLLTWNFAEEILKQQTEYRQKGGKFIIPIPELKIL
jgi:SAM-dependent methyltransferase